MAMKKSFNVILCKSIKRATVALYEPIYGFPVNLSMKRQYLVGINGFQCKNTVIIVKYTEHMLYKNQLIYLWYNLCAGKNTIFQLIVTCHEYSEKYAGSLHSPWHIFQCLNLAHAKIIVCFACGRNLHLFQNVQTTEDYNWGSFSVSAIFAQTTFY